MKIQQRIVTAIGICTASLALLTQAQAGEQGPYFKFDAGVALPQDVTITRMNGLDFPAISYDGIETVDQPKMRLSPGVRSDFAVGYAFNKMLSLEIEGGVVYNPLDKIEYTGTYEGYPFSSEESVSDFSLWQVPVLANVIFTIPLDSKFKPFIGAGAGGIWTILSGEGETDDDFTFAFQGMAGVNYAITEDVDLGIAYKFLGTLQHDLGGLKLEPVYTHSILAVLTARF
jgi:opacity protein-like surface antigen